MAKSIEVLRVVVCACVLVPVAFVPPAFSQSFSLSVASPLAPVNPGGVATATLDLTGSSGSVSFTCAVTPVLAGPPTCLVSPSSATPPAQPSVTVTTAGDTQAASYTVTVTGTDGSTSQSVNLILGVVPVSGNYILSVSPTTATPNPVTAGNVATTTLTITPVATYSGTITLACLSITPPSTPTPICTFSPPTVTVSPNAPAPTSILNINTSNPNIPTTQLRTRRAFYAIWLAVPGLLLVGIGAGGGKKRKILGILFLMAVANSLIVLPSCSSTDINNNGVTPSQTYTITLTGADENGNAPSTTTLPTVKVTVN
jgi:hypothetical protein